jgi:hypothetical protein
MAGPSPAIVGWRRRETDLSDDPMRDQTPALFGISDVVSLNPNL